MYMCICMLIAFRVDHQFNWLKVTCSWSRPLFFTPFILFIPVEWKKIKLFSCFEQMISFSLLLEWIKYFVRPHIFVSHRFCNFRVQKLNVVIYNGNVKWSLQSSNEIFCSWGSVQPINLLNDGRYGRSLFDAN